MQLSATTWVFGQKSMQLLGRDLHTSGHVLPRISGPLFDSPSKVWSTGGVSAQKFVYLHKTTCLAKK
jgi:hypothetical protein